MRPYCGQRIEAGAISPVSGKAWAPPRWSTPARPTATSAARTTAAG